MSRVINQLAKKPQPALKPAGTATVRNDRPTELAEDLDRLAKAEQIERDRQREMQLAAARAVAEFD